MLSTDTRTCYSLKHMYDLIPFPISDNFVFEVGNTKNNYLHDLSLHFCFTIDFDFIR